MPDDIAREVREIGTAAELAQPTTMLQAIVHMAKDPDFDVAKFDALLKMQERTESRQAEIEFNRALARLAEQMPRVKKNGRVDLLDKSGQSRGSYAFAKWEDIDRVIRPLMTAEGFTLSFDAQPRSGDGGGLVVTGTLLHRDGHSRSAAFPAWRCRFRTSTAASTKGEEENERANSNAALVPELRQAASRCRRVRDERTPHARLPGLRHGLAPRDSADCRRPIPARVQERCLSPPSPTTPSRARKRARLQTSFCQKASSPTCAI